MVEIQTHKLRDSIRSDGRFVGYANKEPGGNVSLLFEISPSEMGNIVRALDGRDGGPYPDRILFVCGGVGCRAEKVNRYESDR